MVGGMPGQVNGAADSGGVLNDVLLRKMADALIGHRPTKVGLFFKSVTKPDIELARHFVGEHDAEFGTLACEPNLDC
jgi:hypothetical protein